MDAASAVPITTTVYDALPSLRQMHDVDRASYADIREDYFWDVFERYKPFTCLNVERFYNIFKTVEYVAAAKIKGDFVECGVFLGGSIIGAAAFAKYFGLTDRKFIIFDTFQGFPKGTFERDIGGSTYDLSTLPVFNENFRSVVERNITESGLDTSQFVIVEGKVEDTLHGWSGGALSYLRIDTDYFASTMVELEHLYPRLSTGGALIVDDYGHFDGVRQAVDQYFVDTGQVPPLLQRVDYTGRCGIKIA